MPSVVGREARFQWGENFFLSWKKKKVSPFCFFPLSAKLAICLEILHQKSLEKKKKAPGGNILPYVEDLESTEHEDTKCVYLSNLVFPHSSAVPR